MDEKEFRQMVDRAEAKRQRDRERLEEMKERRTRLLTKAIQTHRVRVDAEQVAADYDPRDRFVNEMRRTMRDSTATDQVFADLLDDPDDA